MKLVTWNCAQGFVSKKKYKALFDLQPDIAVVQEISKKDCDRVLSDKYSGQWFGENPAKGIAVFAREGWIIREIAKPDHRWVVPIEVSGPEVFTLIAIWSWVKKSSYKAYVDRVSNAIASNPKWFERKPVVVAGDFNSSAKWDRQTGNGHTSLVSELEKLGVISSYHHHSAEQQGSEKQHTFHRYRHADKPDHIDYIFVPHEWMGRLKTCSIGSHLDWHIYSDHCPLMAEFSG